jgi:hypothetical protein
MAETPETLTLSRGKAPFKTLRPSIAVVQIQLWGSVVVTSEGFFNCRRVLITKLSVLLSGAVRCGLAIDR